MLSDPPLVNRLAEDFHAGAEGRMAGGRPGRRKRSLGRSVVVRSIDPGGILRQVFVAS
jgi:hypothetical protein